MKILFLSSESDFKGGAERSISILIKELSKDLSMDISFASTQRGKIFKYLSKYNIEFFSIENIDFNRIRRTHSITHNLNLLLEMRKGILTLIRNIKSSSFDIIHTNGIKGHIVSFFIKIFSGGAIRTVWHIRDIFGNPLHRLFLTFIALTADKIILVSHACRRNFFANHQKLTVIRNPVEFHCSANDITIKPLNPKDIQLGIIGRISPLKGQIEGVNIFKTLIQRNLSLTLHIIGDYDENVDYYNRLKKTVDQKEVSDYVKFHGWIDNIEEYYQMLDIVMVPSPEPDPLPRVVYESFFFKRPVFAFDTGGIKEIYPFNRRKYLSPCNINRTCSQIQKYIENQKDYIDDIEKNHSHVVRFLRPEVHCEEVKRIYTEILTIRNYY